jgi:hypothetical protein
MISASFTYDGGHFSAGLVLIAASLLMDAFTGGLQDKVKKRTRELNPLVGGNKRPSMHESMLWTNLSGCLVALLLSLFAGTPRDLLRLLISARWTYDLGEVDL